MGALSVAVFVSSVAWAANDGEIPVTTKSAEAKAAFEQGQALLDFGKPNEARPHFQKALELDPDFAYARLNLANASNSLEEFKTDVEKAVAKASTASEGEQMLIGIAETFLTNDSDKRQELAKKLTAAYPKSPRAWLALANSHATRNEVKESRDATNKAIDLAPNFFLPYRTQAFSYLFTEPRDTALALKAMQKVAELQPKSDQAFVDLGDAYRAANQLEPARDAYAKATQLDPSNGLAVIKKGHINSFLGDYAAARKDFDKAIELAPPVQKGNYANYKAFTSLHEGNPKAAISEMWAILGTLGGLSESEANGVRIFTLNNIVIVAQQAEMADELEKAVSQLDEVLMKQANVVNKPDFVKGQKAAVAFFQGTLAAVKGDYATAEQKAEENKKIIETTDNPARLQGYHGLMGYIALRQGQYDKAVEHLRESNLNAQLNKFQLATALEGAKKPDEARKLYEEISTYNFNAVDFAMLRKAAMKKAGTKSS